MMCRRGRSQAVARICSVFVVLLVISEAADRVGIRRLDLPAYDVKHGSGNFTGFNSVDLQKLYIVQKQPAIRSQISPPGGQKPCLGRLPNGDLLATQQLQGAIALCRSTDNGLSWSAPRHVEVPVVGKLSGRAAMFSALSDGTLLLGHKGMYRSSDEGKTWQKCRLDASVQYGNRTWQANWGENSGPHELSGGTAVCCGYINVAPGHGCAFLFRSTDGGKSWGDPSLVADFCSEVNLAPLPGNRLFACLRQGTRFGEKFAGEGGVVLAVASSPDGGRTWTPSRKILGKAQSPGFPVRLSDGRLVIVFTHRQSPHGAQAIASVDGGKTWDVDHPVMIAWNSFDAYCGHPRSLVLPDDTIVSGFYVRAFHRGGTSTRDVVGHCVRWRVPDDWPTRWPPRVAALKPPPDQKPLLRFPATNPYRLYSGYNSLDLQQIYFTRRRPVVRTQIGPRGGHKPCLARLPDGQLLATQSVDGHVVLFRSTDNGDSWKPFCDVMVPGVGRLRGRARQLAALADGTLLLAHERMYRSVDRGRTWKPCRHDDSIRADGKMLSLRFSESNGPHRLSDGTVVTTAHVSSGGALLDVRMARDGQDGRWDESAITWNNAPDNYDTLLGAFLETDPVGGEAVVFSSPALVDGINADTNDVLDLRLFADRETRRDVQFYYATKEHKGYPGPRLVVEFADGGTGRSRTVVLEPTDDALTRNGAHAIENNETGRHLDIDRMWISGPNRLPGEQQKGYVKFDLSPIKGRAVAAWMTLSKLNGTRLAGSVRHRSVLLRSTDGGQSWGDPSPIAMARDVNVLELSDGKLLGCATLSEDGLGPGVIGLTESADAGRTWTVPRRIDGLGSTQIPGHPLMMPDGRLLIVYGNRQFPFGVQAIASRDGGRTWDTDHPIILAWFSWDHHCGYPRSVLLPDGNIVTAYYARIFTGVPDEIVYTPTNREPGPDVIGHSVRWRPPGNWPTRK